MGFTPILNAMIHINKIGIIRYQLTCTENLKEACWKRATRRLERVGKSGTAPGQMLMNEGRYLPPLNVM